MADNLRSWSLAGQPPSPLRERLVRVYGYGHVPPELLLLEPLPEDVHKLSYDADGVLTQTFWVGSRLCDNRGVPVQLSEATIEDWELGSLGSISISELQSEK
ncbi:hypothetical protein LTS18_007878 [Coniosporium uncinatum]|uniref:Uncharacterized protein n=1 Tax=Coniosporium uncinatum TaxID=93489 RepID=A0ACC3DYS0_9PEZI|nr:hypothetical protein LTS18_007878 [Coniosporium uncinatum]